jgi:hypothetical protein
LIETLPDGAMLLTAVDDIFSYFNEAHRAAAARIAATLAPFNAA